MMLCPKGTLLESALWRRMSTSRMLIGKLSRTCGKRRFVALWCRILKRCCVILVRRTRKNKKLRTSPEQSLIHTCVLHVFFTHPTEN